MIDVWRPHIYIWNIEQTSSFYIFPCKWLNSLKVNIIEFHEFGMKPDRFYWNLWKWHICIQWSQFSAPKQRSISEVVLDPVLTGAWHFTPRCVASRYMRYAFVWTMSEPIIRRASEVQVTRYFSAHIVKPVSSIATYLNCRASQYYMWCAYFVVVIPDALLEQWQIISLFDAFCLINISFDSVCKSILLPAAFSGAILIAIKVTSLDILLFYLAFFYH